MKTRLVKHPHWDPAATPTFWVNHASRLLMRHIAQRLRPLGFGLAYLPVVMAIQENGPLLQKHLAELANVEQPTMAALLGRMERDGLIQRVPHPSDKRACLISLSAKAKAQLPSAKMRLQAVAEQATSGFSKEECAAIIGLMRRMIDNLDQTAED
jgi:DNA-binding MarR family transcriptional regulator